MICFHEKFQDINDCVNDPCKNGGTCTDGIAKYACKCAAGFTGLNCDKSKLAYCALFKIMLFR